jgi:hypothetical protein
MASKPYTGAADVASASPISLTAGNSNPVDVYNIANTGTSSARVYVMLKGAADYAELEGDVPAGTLKIIEGLREVESLKIVGTGSAGVVTA